MKTTFLMIIALICGGLFLVSFQSPVLNEASLDANNGVQLIYKDTVMPDHMTNYPEPFCAVTTIEFEIIHPTWVSIVITCPNLTQETLVFGFYQPGTHAVAYDACNKPCGSYIATMVTYYATEVEVMRKIQSNVRPVPGIR